VTALRLAEAKARAVAARLGAGEAALVIGSDQVATYDGLQIGKPGTHDKALAQLQAMRGREVLFHSALCLFDTRSSTAQAVDIITRVQFRDLPDAALDAYLRAETPYDVAGSAKSEGLGIALLEAIHSDDPTALVGLPLIALSRMLLAVGYPLLGAA
ncbi:MAG TPA: Maf family protein, partial [Paraburkholderia sp.]|nr:Maf family protein [Paraburkholderia sp.]